jgi:hypothetical protein
VRLLNYITFQAVGGVPMMHVDTGAALGLLGFELDLRGCDHFDASKTKLKYVGRVSSANDNACDNVCVSVTGGALTCVLHSHACLDVYITL